MRVWLIAAVVLGSAAWSWATGAPSVELGRQLFESLELGRAGKSCATCHPGGKGLEEIGAYDDRQLKEMINFCIRDALKGRPIDSGSMELESMLLYIRTLQK